MRRYFLSVTLFLGVGFAQLPANMPKADLLWPGGAPLSQGTEDIDKPSLAAYLVPAGVGEALKGHGLAVETPSGTLHYQEAGEGYPLILMHGSGAGAGIGGGRVERLVIEREAGSTRHRGSSRDPILVVKQDAGADAEARAEGINIQRSSGGSQVQLGCGSDAAGGESGGKVEEVAGTTEIEVAVKVGGHLHLDA